VGACAVPVVPCDTAASKRMPCALGTALPLTAIKNRSTSGSGSFSACISTHPAVQRQHACSTSARARAAAAAPTPLGRPRSLRCRLSSPREHCVETSSRTLLSGVLGVRASLRAACTSRCAGPEGPSAPVSTPCPGVGACCPSAKVKPLEEFKARRSLRPTRAGPSSSAARTHEPRRSEPWHYAARPAAPPHSIAAAATATATAAEPSRAGLSLTGG
jgi:hypothetical protein